MNLCVPSREFCRLSFLSVRYSAFGVVLCRLQVHSMVGLGDAHASLVTDEFRDIVLGDMS